MGNHKDGSLKQYLRCCFFRIKNILQKVCNVSKTHYICVVNKNVMELENKKSALIYYKSL